MDTAKSYYQAWADFPQPKKIKMIKIAAFVCFALFLLFVVIYGFGGTGSKSRTLMPTVVFMQAMPADLQALRYLAQRRDFSLAMIVLSVNGWVTNMDAAYENTAAFMTLLMKEGYSKNVPIYYGSSVASVDDSFFSKVSYKFGFDVPDTTTACTYRHVITPALTVSAEGLFGASPLIDLVAPSATTTSASAQFYDEPLNAFLASTQANFLVMGPCTDAAAFLQKHVARRNQVRNIVVGGGSFSGVTGDAQYIFTDNREAEVNFFLDPQAAHYIAQATHGCPVSLVAYNAAKLWNSTAYRQLVTERASTAAATVDEVTSAHVAGVALSGYFSKVGTSTHPVSLGLLAATLLADAYIQNGATVTAIPVGVVHGVGLSKDGVSLRPPGAGDVRVIVGINEEMFVNHLLRVDGLPLA